MVGVLRMDEWDRRMLAQQFAGLTVTLEYNEGRWTNTARPCKDRCLSLMAGRKLLTSTIASATELHKLADSRFNKFYALKLHTAALKADSALRVCVSTWALRPPLVHEHLPISALSTPTQMSPTTSWGVRWQRDRVPCE